MRNTVGHILLSVFVVTLAISNVLLAKQVVELSANTPALSFRLSNTKAQVSSLPSPVLISQLTPDYGSVGTKVKIIGSGFSALNVVRFNYSEIPGIPSSDGKTLVFTVPSYLHYPCTELACPTNDWQKVMPGPHFVTVKNNLGTSNSRAFVVTDVAPTTNKVKIRSLKPDRGPIATKVTITGTGFAKTGNTVNFAYMKIKDLKSNGSTLVFTVPTYLVYACESKQPCPTHDYRTVTPGIYPISVTTPKGTSESVLFTVTQGQ